MFDAVALDLNKGITEIQYNSLNLPRMMIMNSSSVKAKNYYTYSASGVKLRTEQRYDPNYTVTPSNATNPTNDGLTDYKNTDYAGNIIYETVKSGTTLTNKVRILVDGGYIEGGVYYYYLTDHLGNNRVVANQGGTMIQKTHYYPFGSNFATSPGAELQPYKYNGKELDQMHGLNLYDSGARMYDPVIPRTPTPDPHAENYYAWSPYAWVGNNPMNVIDPTGMDWYLNQTTGELYYNKDITDATTKYNDTEYTRIGGNDMMGNMKDISEKAYGFDESAALAANNNYAINPIQQIKSEISREQSYPTGKYDVTITTGEVEIINEKYGIFSIKADKPINTSTKTLYNKEYSLSDIPNSVLLGNKKTDQIERNTYTYTESGTGDKIGSVLGTIFRVLSVTTAGKHDYRNTTVYKNWKSYGNGRMLKYKQ